MLRTTMLSLTICAALAAPVTAGAQAAGSAGSDSAVHVLSGKKHKKHKKHKGKHKRHGRNNNKGRNGKKDNKPPASPTAVVDGTWTVTRENDWNGGTEKEKVVVTIDHATLKFGDSIIAKGTVPVDIKYTADAVTDNSTFSVPGCDSEDRHAGDHYSKEATVYVMPVTKRHVEGKDEVFANGWSVLLSMRLGLKVRDVHGSVDRMDGLSCKRDPVTAGLNWWSPYFPELFAAYGRINGDGKGFMLTVPASEAKQTGSASGTVKFSQDMRMFGLPSIP